MPAKYQIYKDAEGKFRFRLQAKNNQIVAVSEAYEAHASCLNGVKSMQKNCSANIEDMTKEEQRIPNPKYQIFYDAENGYRFHLNARNGEIIAASEGYKSKEACLNGIQAIRDSCNAEIEDTTCNGSASALNLETNKAKTDSIKSDSSTESTEMKSPTLSIHASFERQRKAPKSDEDLTSSTEATSSEAARATDKSGVVFVGNKMPMDYVLAIITGLSSSGAKGITLKARGKSITVAVDAAEITRRRFMKDLKVRKIEIGTEKLPPKQGETRARMVSTIDIVLSKE